MGAPLPNLPYAMPNSIHKIQFISCNMYNSDHTAGMLILDLLKSNPPESAAGRISRAETTGELAGGPRQTKIKPNQTKSNPQGYPINSTAPNICRTPPARRNSPCSPLFRNIFVHFYHKDHSAAFCRNERENPQMEANERNAGRTRYLPSSEGVEGYLGCIVARNRFSASGVQ